MIYRLRGILVEKDTEGVVVDVAASPEEIVAAYVADS